VCGWCVKTRVQILRKWNTNGFNWLQAQEHFLKQHCSQESLDSLDPDPISCRENLRNIKWTNRMAFIAFIAFMVFIGAMLSKLVQTAETLIEDSFKEAWKTATNHRESCVTWWNCNGKHQHFKEHRIMTKASKPTATAAFHNSLSVQKNVRSILFRISGHRCAIPQQCKPKGLLKLACGSRKSIRCEARLLKPRQNNCEPTVRRPRTCRCLKWVTNNQTSWRWGTGHCQNPNFYYRPENQEIQSDPSRKIKSCKTFHSFGVTAFVVIFPALCDSSCPGSQHSAGSVGGRRRTSPMSWQRLGQSSKILFSVGKKTG